MVAQLPLKFLRDAVNAFECLDFKNFLLAKYLCIIYPKEMFFCLSFKGNYD